MKLLESLVLRMKTKFKIGDKVFMISIMNDNEMYIRKLTINSITIYSSNEIKYNFNEISQSAVEYSLFSSLSKVINNVRGFYGND